ncbi:diaminopimelate epimerase [Candidatus Micrarchaeota archaeon]|nr:diaminopimelate epimerase [Candidatus Micrarchaeota archaeon]
MARVKFVKMQGAGNDFIVINEFEKEAVKEAKKKEFAVKACDRHYGIGADGVLFVSKSSVEGADARMRIFNPDASEPEMCGNGIRCAAKFLLEEGITEKKQLSIETLAGIIKPEITEEGLVKVDMGKPVIEKLHDYIFIDGKQVDFTQASMGNPHTVIIVDSVKNIDVRTLGKKISEHPRFPKKTNVHFVEIISRDKVKAVTWERGAGATLACGTGACAIATALHAQGKTSEQLTLEVPGGELKTKLETAEPQNSQPTKIYLIGPAEKVFEGRTKSNILSCL